ncbi:MAG: DUF6010 family protein [Cyanobacteria bacterium P01_D01_bin.105]
MLLCLVLGWSLALLFIHIARLNPTLEKSILAAGLIVAATVYVVLASFTGSEAWIALESAGLVVYGLAAILGALGSPWWLVGGWLAHPVWDIYFHWLGAGALFVPGAYVIVCLSFDLIVAAYIASCQLKLLSQT